MAERRGEDLRRVLRSAERFRERAISFGLRLNTRASRSRALLCFVTSADQRRPRVCRAGPEARTGLTRFRVLVAMDSIRAMRPGWLPARGALLRRARFVRPAPIRLPVGRPPDTLPALSPGGGLSGLSRTALAPRRHRDPRPARLRQ